MDIECNDKIALEPHCGKGDIVDYLNANGASQVLGIELNDDLRKISSSKCEIIGSDFFECTSSEISHIDMIVMNPPFSTADKHIIHAFEIAPEGCEIIALCNVSLIEFGRTRVKYLINDYGSFDSLGNCFKDAERKTNVEVGLVRLYKPVINEEERFDGFFMDEEEEEQNQIPGIQQYNEVRAIVNNYVGTVKSFDKISEMKKRMDNMTSKVGMNLTLSYSNSHGDITKDTFILELQKKSWEYVLKKMNVEKYMTTGVKEKVNRFVHRQSKYPFTMKNVYQMINIIYQTRQENFNNAIIDVVDSFTQYTKENRYGVEGWVTNKGHLLNKKIIVNGVIKNVNGQLIEAEYPYEKSYNSTKINDLNKILCNLTGTNFDSIPSLYEFFKNRTGENNSYGRKEPLYRDRNTWYEWGFFQVKGFLKGTIHMKFKDEKSWYAINKAYGELKGFVLSDNYNFSKKPKRKPTTNKPDKTKEIKKDTLND